jgi:hypothetical protein
MLIRRTLIIATVILTSGAGFAQIVASEKGNRINAVASEQIAAVSSSVSSCGAACTRVDASN